jgi:oligopeptide/dipeptide ABC transporter ATP-binding protein
MTIGGKDRAAVLKGETPSLSAPPAGCRFHTRCAHVVPGVRDGRPPPWQEVGPQRRIRCHLDIAALVSVQVPNPDFLLVDD